jgi:tRNA threonylcarbamoyl adenosine modification protein (Sua5/YciO/YrdC/YwlC family)
MTRILPVHEENPEPRHIKAATDILHKGGIVLAPTETGYCFFGDASKSETYDRFHSLRQAHPRTKPFSLLCRDLTQVSEISVMPTPVFRIAKRALPGPYTFILEANRNTPRSHAGSKRKTIGIRISSHTVTQALVESFEGILAVTSVTDAEELLNDNYFESDADQFDAWWTTAATICERLPEGADIALENDTFVPMHVSTVVDFSTLPPTLIRDGGWDTNVLGLLQEKS